MNRNRYALLTELLRQPTAPFREDHVARFVARVLDGARVPYFRDPIGNIVVGCDGTAEYRKILRSRSGEPVRVFIAHMDHPGFHGVRWLAPARLQIKWHGGSPTKRLNGSKVWLAQGDAEFGTGTLAKVRMQRSGRSIDAAELTLTAAPAGPRPPARRVFGGFNFRAPVWRSGQRLYTRAADDLIGVFAVIDTALERFRRQHIGRPNSFIGLLTRAEEVGFVGAIGHLDLGWLERAHRPVVCISLETSRALPGAKIGKGPVVRLGDRKTVFDCDALKLLADVASSVLPKRHQRRIMDGGTCEATAATVYGYPAIGISVPLGNYHNQGLEGGPDSRGPNAPAPEFVHLNDVDGLLTLCRALLRPGLPWSRPWHSERKTYTARLRSNRSMLSARLG